MALIFIQTSGLIVRFCAGLLRRLDISFAERRAVVLKSRTISLAVRTVLAVAVAVRTVFAISLTRAAFKATVARAVGSAILRLSAVTLMIVWTILRTVVVTTAVGTVLKPAVEPAATVIAERPAVPGLLQKRIDFLFQKNEMIGNFP